MIYHIKHNILKTDHISFFSVQTKRDEPSSIVDYEKIDQDARVSHAFNLFEFNAVIKSIQFLWMDSLH